MAARSFFTSALVTAFALALTGCGGSGSGGGAGGSAGAGTGGGGLGGVGGGIGGATSGGTGGTAGTGGSVGTGGAAGSGGAATCTPSGGSAVVDVSCDGVSLAVLQMSGQPTTLRVAGRLIAANGACLKVDSIDLVRADKSVVQTVPGAGTGLKSWDNATWGSATAASEIVTRCADETDRVEPYGIIVKGVTDGGTFEAKCGIGVEMGSAWPPRVMLGCHDGLTDPPAFGNAMIQPMGPSVTTQLFGELPHPPGPGISAVDGNVRIVPFASGFGGPPPPQPFDTSGWDTSLSEGTIPVTGQVATSFNGFNQNDVLGDACPPPPDMDAAIPTPPPIFIAKLTGSAAAGPFKGELLVSLCTRP